METPTFEPEGTRTRRAFGRLALTLALLLAPGLASAQEDPLEKLDSFIQTVLDTWDAPGLALAVVRGDSVLVARGYGLRDLRSQAPVDQHSLFAVASTSKAFTVAALGILVDEGKISWDDRVTDLLPGFQLSDPYVTPGVHGPGPPHPSRRAPTG